jgi:hypothetical protein
MTNFVIKNDLFFTLQKSEGNTDFPRKFYARKVSGNQIKIRTLGSNEALLDVWSLENFTINGVAYTDVHLAITALQAILWNDSSGNASTPVDVLPILTEIRDELINDDSCQLFEDTDGNVLFGKIDNNGIMKYYKPDGTIYTGVVKPYSSGVITSSTDYCANSVPYTLIQFRDVDTKQVIASIWRNDNTFTESSTAPVGSVKGVCTVVDTTGKSCVTPIYSSICNVGKRQDLISWVATAGQTATIPLSKFSTFSLMATKGEFTIANTANNFAGDITFSGGAQSAFVEISEDGIGTTTGSTSVAKSIDTRADMADIDLANNSYLITCVRTGVLAMDLYK